MDTPLDPNATYISPTGHRCRWEPLGGKDRHYTVSAYFVYLDRRKRLADEGFTLKACNYKLLKRETVDASAG